MGKTLYNTFRLLRPRQWIKNFAVFAAILFGGALFDFDVLAKVIWAFLIFCGLSSGIYIINDISDREKDKLHPFKRFRPLAHGDVPLWLAVILSITLIMGSFIAGLYITPAFVIITLVYLLLQISYSLFLKNIAVIDILALAAGYILRVYAGEFASGYHISVWLLLTTITLSLFLAVGKRRSELTLVSQYPTAQINKMRKTLSHYSDRLLDVYASIFATSTFIAYSLFTFLENPLGFKLQLGFLMPEFLPEFFQRKWLMITIIPVVYGLMRYLQDIYEKHEGESPDRVLLSDKPLIVTVLTWALLVIVIIYILGG